ncbi:SCO2521 family protein [Nocardia sp. NPDC005366]|uniref:SCO2521 family protein n=1 Tax=Nocardia sp. NPDC005366 TaxID=3156878 RepID=UPI0033B3424D
MATPLVVLGEIRTCLLPSATALSQAEASELLALMPGSAVRWKERPGKLAISPTIAVGVDCDLALGDDPVREGGFAHIVGTVATNAVLVGGRVLQSSAHTRVVRATDRRRQTWSHYISCKGITEVINRIPEREIAEKALVRGYFSGPFTEQTLDLASISERLLGDIRMAAQLDQRPPIRARTTRLRWTARIGGSAGPATDLRLDDDRVRSIQLIVREEKDLTETQRFCEDLAVHDWLLTVMAELLDEADHFPSRSPKRIDTLAPALEHLTGLWMPGGHTPTLVRALWKELQNDPGFTRQWTTLVSRLRDNIAVATLDALRYKAFTGDAHQERAHR